MIFIIFFLSTALLAQGLPSRNVGEVDWDGDTRIVGGSDAKFSQFPYKASLRFPNGNHFCGGSIIGEQIVLTAAHCVLAVKAKDMMVWVNTTELISGGTSYAVKETIPHKDYSNKTYLNDIALVLCSKKIAMSSTVSVVALANKKTEVGAACIVLGWGILSYPDQPWQPNNLQWVSTFPISMTDCQKAYKNYTEAGQAISEGQVCCKGSGTNPTTGPCHGDSGGPLVCNGKLVGVVSWSRSCIPSYPQVYADVSSYIPWINANKKLFMKLVRPRHPSFPTLEQQKSGTST